MHDKRARIKFIETCYKLYEQRMYQVAVRILRDSGMAEDAVQEAFLKLMKSDIYFANAASDDCKRYLITVIKHASITVYNKRQKEREIMYLCDKDDLAEEPAAVQEDPDIEQIRELIFDLPPKYSMVVKCLALDNLSVKETARELGITETNVRKRFERSKTMLKSILEGGKMYEKGRPVYESRIS
ncbi:MAG: RNA polymerase sigma factor [Coprococcus sp.]|nr:RNA polymerase sigma factor [Coprococcus sp.]